MDFKSKTWWINPHKGYWSWKGKTQNFDEDVKKYTKKTNKKAFFHSDQLDLKDDLEMKKLQSTYYWVVIVLGFVLYNFLKY